MSPPSDVAGAGRARLENLRFWMRARLGDRLLIMATLHENPDRPLPTNLAFLCLELDRLWLLANRNAADCWRKLRGASAEEQARDGPTTIAAALEVDSTVAELAGCVLLDFVEYADKRLADQVDSLAEAAGVAVRRRYETFLFPDGGAVWAIVALTIAFEEKG